MALVSKHDLVNELCPPMDVVLAVPLIDEYISIEHRFVLRDWEPATLDGGQFVELAARILYHQDSGQLSLRKDANKCFEYIEDDARPHLMLPRHDAIHLAKTLRTIYKFRSQRGAVHISPHYSPNEMDARLVVECVRWCFAEILRIFWSGDREAVAQAIREIIQYRVPCIGNFEDVIIVQRTDIKVDQEILILLHYAGEAGFSRKEIGRHCAFPPPRISEALSRLVSRECRQVVITSADRYRLTDLGEKRIREELSEKLSLSD